MTPDDTLREQVKRMIIENTSYEGNGIDRSDLPSLLDDTLSLIEQEKIKARIDELESFIGHSSNIPENELKYRINELRGAKDESI
jgi:hypothetical protein